MVFHWSLRDSKSPQISRTLLSILANLNNIVVWMVSTCPIICKSFNPFTNLMGIFPAAPITIGITVTFIFHSFFFTSVARSRYLSLLSLSFNFTGWSGWTAQSTIWKVLFFFFFLLTFTRPGRLAVIRRSVCLSKSQRSLCFWFSFVSFSHQS